MKTSTTTSEVFNALTDAARELNNPAKSSTVSTGKYRYTFAPLPEILEEVRGVLGKHDLAVIQEATEGERGVGVTTRLVHSSGEWIEYGPLVLPAGNDAQSYGSAITYARRYSLCAALGIAADEDDDGNASKPASGDVRAISSRPAGPSPDSSVPSTSGAEGDGTGSSEAEAHRRGERVAASSTEHKSTASESSEGGDAAATGKGSALPPPDSLEQLFSLYSNQGQALRAANKKFGTKTMAELHDLGPAALATLIREKEATGASA